MCCGVFGNLLSHMLSHCFWASVTGSRRQNAT
nr:MAG TPA: hypothetical protein [Caudoviricetes sp.]DAG31125.1 MAG TPA: hypothetical protein [Caudoviricetes sp.]